MAIFGDDAAIGDPASQLLSGGFCHLPAGHFHGDQHEFSGVGPEGGESLPHRAVRLGRLNSRFDDSLCVFP